MVQARVHTSRIGESLVTSVRCLKLDRDYISLMFVVSLLTHAILEGGEAFNLALELAPTSKPQSSRVFCLIIRPALAGLIFCSSLLTCATGALERRIAHYLGALS